ncbi:MAG: hypothetical protein PVI86_09290 [Phycisphaerae bacterium]|jgi:hypothetical protein
MSDAEKDIERIERLIARKLDGELREDEELELNRELIRNPDARRLMEDYERIDGLAATALTESLSYNTVPVESTVLARPPQPSLGHKHHRGWWLVPGAVAAALFAVMLGRFAPTPPTTSETPVAEDRRSPLENRIPVVERPGPASDLHRNVGLRDKIKRDTGREIIGVVGEDGNLYWIEIDRIRTFKQPGANWAKPVSLEEL